MANRLDSKRAVRSVKRVLENGKGKEEKRWGKGEFKSSRAVVNVAASDVCARFFLKTCSQETVGGFFMAALLVRNV